MGQNSISSVSDSDLKWQRAEQLQNNRKGEFKAGVYDC